MTRALSLSALGPYPYPSSPTYQLFVHYSCRFASPRPYSCYLLARQAISIILLYNSFSYSCLNQLVNWLLCCY